MSVWLILAGCDVKATPMEMKRVDVGTGYSLSIPKDYAAVADGDRVRVYLPAREKSRAPVNITLSTASRPPDWKKTKAKHVGTRDVHYAIREEDGGSGGSALRLLAWTLAERRHVLLESVVQPDVGGDGEFRAEWAILGALR